MNKRLKKTKGTMSDGINSLSLDSENICQNLNATSINYNEFNEFIKEEAIKRKVSKSGKAKYNNRKYAEELKAAVHEFDSGFFQIRGAENQVSKLCKYSITTSTTY